MTGEDHDTDALIAALTSPALPSEQVGEDAAVTAMLAALPGEPAGPVAGRSRRSIAIAAVTIASLGVGGLVAAGPGAFFSPAADRPPATRPSTAETDPAAPLTTVDASDDARPTGPNPTSTSSSLPIGAVESPVDADRAGSDEETDCDATHGDVVSDAARSTVPDRRVREVARSDCGKPDAVDRESPSDTAPGQTGDRPAVTAPGRTGDTPAATTPATTAPGRTGDTPAVTTPADTAPGRTDEAPADTAPARNDSAGNAGASGDHRP